MARMVGRSRPVVEGSTSIRFSEMIVIALVIAGVVMGVRYYINYRKSASYALRQYIGAIKAGDVHAQYALIDDQDKAKFTQSEYDKDARQAHGYVERILNIDTFEEKPVPNNPDEVDVPASVTIRASSSGKELYQGTDSKAYKDTFRMHKGSDGQWKVVLSKSGNHGQLNMLQAEPSPQGMF